MRFAFTFALGLSVLFLGLAPRRQDAAGPANVPSQSPTTHPPPAGQAPPAPPAGTAPDTTAPAGQQAPENDTRGRSEPDSADTDSTKTNPTDSGSTKSDPAKPDSTPSAAAESSSAATKSGVTKRPARSASGTPAAPRKVVVRQGGAKEPATQIAPGMTPAEAARERQNAEERLRATSDQLPQLEVLPDVHQQETVVQIRNYMDGARSALKEGDVRRASTLAEKAHLLAEDLLKR